MRISQLEIQTHAALELGLAAALIALPFVLGLPASAIILGVALGALLGGLALTGSDPAGRGGLSLSAHAAYDVALDTALLVAAIALGVADGARPMIVFLAAGAAELTLMLSTRYTARQRV